MFVQDLFFFHEHPYVAFSAPITDCVLIIGQSQNKHLVRWHNYISLLWASNHSIYYQHQDMARCFLGKYRSLRSMLASCCWSHG